MKTWRVLLTRLLLSLAVLGCLLSVPLAVAQTTGTGWVSPSRDDGLVWSNRDRTYADDDGYAEYGSDWGSENHAMFWGYGFNIPGRATIQGIEVRLDWWLDGTVGANYLDVDLSWDGGNQWTSVHQATTESGYDRNPTDVLGADDDTWGRTWTAEEFSDLDFRVRVRARTDQTRFFYLDWIPVRITYSVSNNPPDPPTNLLCEGQTNPTGVTDITPDFAWAHSDPDGDSQSAWQIQVGTDNDWDNGAEMWDSGQQSSSEPVAVYGGSTLDQGGVTYYWRVRTWDSYGAESAWSATQQFTVLLNCDALSLGPVTFIDHEALGEDGGRVALRVEGMGAALPVTSVTIDWQHLDDLDDTLGRDMHLLSVYLDPTGTDFQGGDYLAQNMDAEDSPSTADDNPRTLLAGGGYILLDFDPTDVGRLDELPWDLVGTDFGFTVEFDGCPALTLDRVPRDQPPLPEPCPFFEEGGQVVLEAEHYVSNVAGGGHSWQHGTSQAGYSAWGYMEAVPDGGTGHEYYTDIDDSPYMDYPIYFFTTGTYYVWVRGWAADNGDDSIHAGLDGIVTDASDRITHSAFNQWDWSRTTMDSGSPAAYIQVDEAGLHVFNLFMREDGFRVDKVVLTTSNSSTPPADGIAESYCCQPPDAPPSPGPPPGHRDCSQVLLQGSFEGDEGIEVPDGSWVLTDEAYAVGRTNAPRYSGNYSLALWSFAVPNYGARHPWVYQQVTLPSDVVADTELALTLYYYVEPQRLGSPREEDVLYVKLRDSGETDIASDTAIATGASPASTWTQHSGNLADGIVDLTSYAGQDVQLYFHAPNSDNEGDTAFYIDSVRFDVCNTQPIPELDPTKATVGGNLRVWQEGMLSPQVGVPVWAYRTDGGDCRPGEPLCVTSSIHNSTYHFYNIEPGEYVIYSEAIVGTQLRFDMEAVTVGAGEDVDVNLAL